MPAKGGKKRRAAASRAAQAPTQSKEADHPEFPDLPQYKGPKLHIFEHHKSPIQWLERLDVDRAGMQGYIFKAKIKSAYYAVKVFKPYDIEENRGYWEAYLDQSASMHDIVSCMDPFYAECRAYGAILNTRRQRNVKMNIALPCYGYIELKDADEKVLSERGFNIRDESPLTGPWITSQPKQTLKAIVKMLAEPESGITTRRPKEILKGIKALNKIQVYNRDLRLDNFLNAQIVDFGSAWTEPHIIMDAANEDELDNFRKEDLGLYDQMVEGKEFNTTTRALFPLSEEKQGPVEKTTRYNLRSLGKIGHH